MVGDRNISGAGIAMFEGAIIVSLLYCIRLLGEKRFLTSIRDVDSLRTNDFGCFLWQVLIYLVLKKV